MSTISISIPDSLKERVEQYARRDGISVADFVASVLSQRMAVADADSYISKRAARGSADKMRELLDRAPDVSPDDDDKISSNGE